MKKRLENLVEKFKKKELELLEILNEKNVIFDESQEKAVVKKSLKDYIKKVNKAKKIFDEYETLAKEIEDITGDEGESAELSKTVVEFREEIPLEEQAEIEVEKEKQSSKKTKKVSKKAKEEKEPVK
ncbi:MAG: hypothetical protein IJA23_00515 [Clostridia bacterium]|nr:hypothetical protein [Clostridia bacterium]